MGNRSTSMSFRGQEAKIGLRNNDTFGWERVRSPPKVVRCVDRSDRTDQTLGSTAEASPVQLKVVQTDAVSYVVWVAANA